MAVIIAPGGRLTPLLSTGFPHSLVFAMTVFGLTFCGNGSSLFVTALLDSACPLDTRSESKALVYSVASVTAVALLTVLSALGRFVHSTRY